MKRIASISVLFALAITATAQRLTDYVDPMIGSGDHGHVFVGANVPQGMVNVGPTQLEEGWDWCSGYHQTGERIIGFSHMHLSGTGCADLGDITLMPTLQEVELSREGVSSTYSHERESVRPGYYSVILDRGNIKCEMTATKRVALHKYTFPRGSNNARIIINLKDAVSDELQQARVYQLNEYTVAGYRLSHGWANRQQVYFYMQFSKPIHNFLSPSIDNPYAQATFEVGPGDDVMVKVGLSPVNEMNALQNINVEMPQWDFDAVRERALENWDVELSRIKATFRTDRERRIFYTAMYHFLYAPVIWGDCNGDYMGSDGRVYRDAGFQNYTIWSLWDTYRAAHPLATLILRDELRDYAQTMLHIYKEQGELPVWHLMSNETYCMVGCPAVPVLADMVLKGVEGFDYQEAVDAMKASLLKDNRQLDHMKNYGYIPWDQSSGEVVAKTLEYYLADWSCGKAAAKVGDKDSTYFLTRCKGYKKMFDPEKQCMRALSKAGKFRDEPNFNPCHQTRDYTEGNPWQYTWLVPHDIPGLVSCFPSQQAFIDRLDALFEADADLGEGAQPDITGLIGQYAHGNEPSHHILYIYNYVGQPWKTQQRVRQVMSELYTDQPAGLCGNEDVGQMSAWYILSAMGLYQVEPCGGKYQLGSPVVEEAVIPVKDNKTFTIRSHGNSDKAIYVKEVRLNGKPLTETYVTYDDIMAGGTLDFYMSTKPVKKSKKK